MLLTDLLSLTEVKYMQSAELLHQQRRISFLTCAHCPKLQIAAASIALWEPTWAEVFPQDGEQLCNEIRVCYKIVASLHSEAPGCSSPSNFRLVFPLQ